MSIGSESSLHMLSLTSPAGKLHAPSRAREEETLKAILQVRPRFVYSDCVSFRDERDLRIGKCGSVGGEGEDREGGMLQLLCCRGVSTKCSFNNTGTTLLETGLGERRLVLSPVAVSSSLGRVNKGVQHL
jgi:hypothetical protein